MSASQRAVISILVITGILAALPGIIYVVCLFRVDGRPQPADPASYARSDIVSAWQACREASVPEVRPANPWGVAGKLLFVDRPSPSPGERAAWQIARAHNSAHWYGDMLWWHTSGAALTIWITRHWSAEQVGATLVRDELCR